MSSKFIKLVFIIFCLGILSLMFIFTPYPLSWEQASSWQILLIFVPLLILFTLLAELFLNYLPRSFIVGLGLMVIMVLQALNVLNPLLVIEILLVSILAARLFPRVKLTHSIKIPMLRLSNEPKKSKLTRLERRKRA